jgi:nucleoside-diphosphate-sugar epimerase
LGAPRETVHDRAFNVGFSGANHQVRDLADIVAEAVGGCRVMITRETGPDPRSYRVDFSRLEAAFPHLEQSWDTRRGAADLARRLREHGLTNADRPRFTRLHRLTELRERGALSPSLRWVAG